jgi:CheY-like chemotaxis protein
MSHWDDEQTSELGTVAAPAWKGLQPCLVGAWRREEFALVRREIDSHSAWRQFESLPDAMEEVGEDVCPEVLLLAQARPNPVLARELEILSRRLPLARVVLVAGPWCEGEYRTGAPPLGVVRILWHELPAWWRVAAGAVGRGQAPPWAAPLDDLRAGAAIDGSTVEGATACDGASPRPILLASRSLEACEALKSALGPWGWEVDVCRSPAGEVGEARSYAAGVWEGGHFGPSESVDFRRFVERLRGAPVIALLHAPRAAEWRTAKAAGAASILAKPFQASLLAAELSWHAVG